MVDARALSEAIVIWPRQFFVGEENETEDDNVESQGSTKQDSKIQSVIHEQEHKEHIIR